MYASDWNMSILSDILISAYVALQCKRVIQDPCFLDSDNARDWTVIMHQISHFATTLDYFLSSDIFDGSTFQGYRDASCLFVEMLLNKDKASSSSTHLEYTKSDYCLCLAIHAPRKGIIEVICCLIFSGFFLPSLQFEILNSNVNIPEIGH
jgi:hypothetical protein